MSRWTPCKRRQFVRWLRKLGFTGLYAGTGHQFMVFAHFRLAIPSDPEYSVPQLRLLIHEVEGILGREVPLDEWSSL